VHDVPESLRPALRGAALGDSMLRVLSAATISLNPHGNFMRYGGNMRLFEAAAVGSFQIVDDRPGVHEWFREGEHLVIYRNLDDLREKVRYYLAHPEERQRIAQAARQHVLAHHTYDQRLDRLEQIGFFRAPDSAR
jgi:spore maturation protein CgeB